MKVLVTGGAGFIGSEFVRQGVKKGYRIVVVDKLTYAGDLKRLCEVRGRYMFYKADICDKKKMEAIFRKERPAV
ncbi:MAG TPA: SDR family NAD(P)-dependent oxidoreductase, partial [Candidatus Omnitrophota bacterium]|nr:SDR family NAD(P)-dependent oxidoreductase [Candidatus Omnitrophota bacterium]